MSLFKRNSYFNYLQIYDFWLHFNLNKLIIFPFCFASVVIVFYIFYNHKLSYGLTPTLAFHLSLPPHHFFLFRELLWISLKTLDITTKHPLGLFVGCIWMGLRVSADIDHEFAFIKIFILSFHHSQTCCFEIIC